MSFLHVYILVCAHMCRMHGYYNIRINAYAYMYICIYVYMHICINVFMSIYRELGHIDVQTRHAHSHKYVPGCPWGGRPPPSTAYCGALGQPWSTPPSLRLNCCCGGGRPSPAMRHCCCGGGLTPTAGMAAAAAGGRYKRHTYMYAD